MVTNVDNSPQKDERTFEEAMGASRVLEVLIRNAFIAVPYELIQNGVYCPPVEPESPLHLHYKGPWGLVRKDSYEAVMSHETAENWDPSQTPYRFETLTDCLALFDRGFELDSIRRG